MFIYNIVNGQGGGNGMQNTPNDNPNQLSCMILKTFHVVTVYHAKFILHANVHCGYAFKFTVLHLSVNSPCILMEFAFNLKKKS